MANRWLFKTEPTAYSFQQLQKDKRTVWDGVKNNLALKHLSGIKKGDLKKEKPRKETEVSWRLEVIEIEAPPVSKELKKRWSYFIRKVYETDPLTCPRCEGEMRIISFIDQLDVIKKILQHLGLWEESHAPPDRGPAEKKLVFDSSYSQLI